MSILDLINAVEKNDDCSTVASEVFQQKYAEKQFIIEKYPNKYAKYPNQNTDDSEILISNLQAGIKMLNRFGHLIQELKLRFNQDMSLCEPPHMDEVLSILKAIDAHCRESLVKFIMFYRGCNVNNIFNQIKGPFKRVEYVASFLSDMNEQTKDLQFYAVFPNVQELATHLNADNNRLLNDCELPKLKNLTIYGGLGNANYESNEPILINLLRKNPQITKLKFWDSKYKVLRHVQKYLTHLKELDLNELIEERTDSRELEEIHFPTVERFRMRLGDKQCPAPNAISFNVNAIREIELICDSGNLTEESLNFLLKYTKIRKLLAGNGLHNVTLLKLIGKFPEISHAAFDFDDDVSVNNIIEFIKQTSSLNQLKVIYENFENFDSFVNQLKMELDTDFNIKLNVITTLFSKTVYKKISIERKIPITNTDSI